MGDETNRYPFPSSFHETTLSTTYEIGYICPTQYCIIVSLRLLALLCQHTCVYVEDTILPKKFGRGARNWENTNNQKDEKEYSILKHAV